MTIINERPLFTRYRSMIASLSYNERIVLQSTAQFIVRIASMFIHFSCALSDAQNGYYDCQSRIATYKVQLHSDLIEMCPSQVTWLPIFWCWPTTPFCKEKIGLTVCFAKSCYLDCVSKIPRSKLKYSPEVIDTVENGPGSQLLRTLFGMAPESKLIFLTRLCVATLAFL